MEEIQESEVFCKLSEVFQRGENMQMGQRLTGEYSEGSELTIEFHDMEVIADPDKVSFGGGLGRKDLTEECSR